MTSNLERSAVCPSCGQTEHFAVGVYSTKALYTCKLCYWTWTVYIEKAPRDSRTPNVQHDDTED